MTNQVIPIPPLDPVRDQAWRKRRRAAEVRFRIYGMGAIALAGSILFILLGTIVANGWDAFWETRVKLTVQFSEEYIDPQGLRSALGAPPPPVEDEAAYQIWSDAKTAALKALRAVDYRKLYRDPLKQLYPEVAKKRRDRNKSLYSLLSDQNQYVLMRMVLKTPELVGTTKDMWLMAHTNMDMYNKNLIDMTIPEQNRKVSNRMAELFEDMRDSGLVRTQFATQLFTNGASSSPEVAGLRGALVGSFWTLLVTLIASFPIGVLSAVYLEEFAPRNRATAFIEVNINNLAAVPSIVFGLLGLAVFINMMGMPRSAPLVGGLTLALMTLPTIIIATRAALKAVPPSIKNAALALGASPFQTMFHHTLPLALPGILTGAIIGMAQALGETAPLLMIGMVAFVQEFPASPLDPASVLPVQVFLWSDSPERAFSSKTSAAIMILLAFLVSMNMLAIALRKRFERRW